MSRWKRRGWQDSPMVRQALQEREPDDIAVVTCDGCGSVTYYNQGSHCTCEHCDRSLDHLLIDGEVTTLADHWNAWPDEEGS
jgi:uncharacterized OB-fold protein